MAYRRKRDTPDVFTVTDAIRADFNAARESRFRRRRKGFSATGTGADYHYRTEADFLRVMELARDMDRNDCIVGQTVNRAVLNTVQNGITVDPQTGDQEVDDSLKQRWADWSEDATACDLAREHTFNEIESIVLRQTFIDGDIVALGTQGEFGDALELIEGHRLRTPSNTKRNVVHGVLLDENRQRLEYWFTKDNLDPMAPLKLVGQVRPYRVWDSEGYRQIFHVYTPKRVTQTRGITALAPIFDELGMFEDIQFARLVQQQVVSCFGVFRQRELDFRGPADTQMGTRTTDTFADGTPRTLEGIGPGMDIAGAPGETLAMFNPNVPTPAYFEHVKLILTIVGANLGIPFAMLFMDAGETNFSGWRGAVDQARLGFKQNQRAFIGRFHRPIYRWKLGQWLSDDAGLRTKARELERAGISIFKHRWNPPTWPYIEPKKDAEADIARLKGNLTSQRRLQAEKGREWSEVATEIVEDNALLVESAMERAADINGRYPDAMVDWRELAGFDLKGRLVYLRGQQSAAQAAASTEPSEAALALQRVEG